MAEQKVKKVKRILFGILVSLLKGFIEALPDNELKGALHIQFQRPLEEFGKVLTDNDPNDIDQIKQKWKEINGDFEDASLENIKTLIGAKIKNEEVKEILISILEDYQDSDYQITDEQITPSIKAVNYIIEK